LKFALSIFRFSACKFFLSTLIKAILSFWLIFIAFFHVKIIEFIPGLLDKFTISQYFDSIEISDTLFGLYEMLNDNDSILLIFLLEVKNN
jgi:hypothetical protein